VDLSDFDLAKGAESGADLALRNPVTDEPLLTEDGAQITIRLVGMDSGAYRRALHQIQNRKLGRLTRGKSPSMELVERDELELLAACTVGWSGVVVDGAPLEFSAQNAVSLYERFRWIKEQVDAYIGDRENFFQNASNA
jgi:hypothetical protein